METLQKWVVELFSGVQEGGHGRMTFLWDGPIWKSNLIYYVESVRDDHRISMLWPLPCLEGAYLKKPHEYLSHLIGHGMFKTPPSLSILHSSSQEYCVMPWTIGKIWPIYNNFDVQNDS